MIANLRVSAQIKRIEKGVNLDSSPHICRRVSPFLRHGDSGLAEKLTKANVARKRQRIVREDIAKKTVPTGQHA
jgi:hypothetical protein